MKKLLIGRREEINLPQFKLSKIDAKVDTGAFTSAIHCHYIELKVNKKGDLVLHFELLDPSHPQYKKHIIKTQNFKKTRVKSSNGNLQERYVIQTELELYRKSFITEFSLTTRKDMKYPILLGRKFIQKGFIVDVCKFNIAES